MATPKTSPAPMPAAARTETPADAAAPTAAPAATPATTTVAAAAPPSLLSMGQLVTVRMGPGVLRLRNNEVGGFFESGQPVAQTVTVTLLSRLRDGDLVLC